jgi:hypothetical protein
VWLLLHGIVVTVGIDRETLRRAYVRCSDRCVVSGGSGVSESSSEKKPFEVKAKLFKFGLTRYLTKLLFIRGMGGNDYFHTHLRYLVIQDILYRR